MSKKSVVVAGALGVLGQSVVRRFLSAGYFVVGLDISSNQTTDFSSKDFEMHTIDLSDANQLFQIAKKCEAASPPDILVNCAGGFRFLNTNQIKDQDVEFLVRSNFLSSLQLSRAFVPGMKSRKHGHIVFVGAAAALNPTAGMGLYTATKAALHAWAIALADELKNDGVSIHTVMPTILDTPANRKDMPNADFTQWIKTDDLAEQIYSFTQKPMRSL